MLVSMSRVVSSSQVLVDVHNLVLISSAVVAVAYFDLVLLVELVELTFLLSDLNVNDLD